MTETTLSFFIIVIYLLCCLIDRFLIKRGKVKISGIDTFPDRSNSKVFSMHYWIKKLPRWSRVTYSLIDLKNPTTVIEGSPRSLAYHPYSNRAHNYQSEFLFIDANHVYFGEWLFIVRIETNPSRFNPFYSLFPLKTEFHKSVIYNKPVSAKDGSK